MATVVFVDDDAGIVTGLRRSLYRRRDEWDMVFVDSPEAALAVLESQPVDVIVTDMRMPRIDGAELLRRARALQPGAARLILTGHSDPEASLRALAVAHQVLSKPCDPVDLGRAIERACSVQRLLGDERLQRAIGALETLPSVPDVFNEMNECLERGASPRTIAAVVQHDGVVVGRVLQLVNSSFFGLGRRITDVAEAIAYLGIDVLRSVVASTACFQAFDPATSVPGFSLKRTHAHAFDTGRMCRSLLTASRNAADAVAGALLQDFGQVVLVASISADFADAIAATGPHRPLHAVEAERFGFTHAEVGAYLLALWNLPNHVVEAVARHHDDRAPMPLPSSVPAPEGLAALDVPDAVRVARALVHTSERFAPDPMDGGPRPIPTAWLEALGGGRARAALRRILDDPEKPV